MPEQDVAQLLHEGHGLSLRVVRGVHQDLDPVVDRDRFRRPVAANGARAILVVRDLASGCRLLERPVPRDDAATTEAVLETLFIEHGPPLVLKPDNGGHFTAEEVRALLERWRVLHLLSPARTPTYNGSIESAIGCSKASVASIAARYGHPVDRGRHRRGAASPTTPCAPGESTARRLLKLLASGVVRESHARRAAIRRASDEYGILSVE